MNSEPLITVIVAVFDGARTLQRCIDSVTNQTYLNRELIIIDGGSKDGTVDILTANNDRITYWESEPDKGIYHAWNKALNHANGNWICFLGADDYLWKKSVFEEIMPHIIKAESQDIRLVYGQVAMVTEDNEVCYIEGAPWKNIWKNAIIDGICTFAHQGMFHHRSLFERFGRFDESFHIIGDYEMLIRAFKDGADAYFINGLIVTGMQKGGVSSDYKRMAREIIRARRNNRLRGITIPWVISYVWFFCYPFFEYVLGKRDIRYLVNFGKRVIGCLPYGKIEMDGSTAMNQYNLASTPKK